MIDTFDTSPEWLAVSHALESLAPIDIEVFGSENAHGIPFAQEDGVLTITWWRAQDIGRALGLPERDTRRICADLFKAECGMVCKMFRGQNEYAGTWWLNELAIVPFACMARSIKSKRGGSNAFTATVKGGFRFDASRNRRIHRSDTRNCAGASLNLGTAKIQS